MAKLPVGVLAQMTSVRFKSKRPKKDVKADRERRKFAAKGIVTDSEWPPGYGERIYLFHHILDGITVYSSTPVLQVCPFFICITYIYDICANSLSPPRRPQKRSGRSPSSGRS